LQLPSEPIQRLDGTDRYLVPQPVLVRAIAYVIDAFCVAFISVMVLYTSGSATTLTAGDLTRLEFIMLGALCGFRFIFEGAVGWTPGKRLLGLRVVRTDGRPCGWAAALARNVLLPIDMLPVLGLIAVVSMAVGFKRQRLGDRLGGTTVVRPLPLAMVPPPYVPADQPVRRCGSCGSLQPEGQSTCSVCGAALRRVHRPAAFAGAPAGAAAAPAGHLGGLQLSQQSSMLDELQSEDDGTRLTAARQALIDGSRADLTVLADLALTWNEEDKEFIINIARTLSGWRPRIVLAALSDDQDQEVAAAAREALDAVMRRTAPRPDVGRVGDHSTGGGAAP
jgi:uncharacterized RDD family membrane protein YckC